MTIINRNMVNIPSCTGVGYPDARAVRPYNLMHTPGPVRGRTSVRPYRVDC